MTNQTMIMTYDNEANASYLYFTPIGPAGVDNTITYQRMDVGLDNNDQIINIKLYESEERQFQNRLKYALQYPEVNLGRSGGSTPTRDTQQSVRPEAAKWFHMML